MKICSIRIKGYKQFKDIYLDFTNPETGRPVDKICFIGRNGTGKSTILEFLDDIIKSLSYGISFIQNTDNTTLFVKIESNEEIIRGLKLSYDSEFVFLKPSIENIPNWFEILTAFEGTPNQFEAHFIIGSELVALKRKLNLKDNSSDLVIYSPSESQQNSYLSISDVPQSTLNEALSLFRNFPFHHHVSDQNVQEFWQMLIYLIKKRDNEREVFENKKENLNKTKQQLIDEFEKVNPKILNKLADLWNTILDKAGLEFDVEGASNPIQLNDNLKAYIRLKGSKQNIPYSQLSTGIRNFIFRVGHIYSLYFNREIKRGFLFLDEPENSLFPDFLFDLIEVYQSLLVDKNGENNTQMFVSTHSPIIAAQFEPYERIVLEWNDEGFVNAHKGTAPVGDDPNDILTKDFQLKNLMGKKGQEMWAVYLNLRKKLRRSENPAEKEELVSKINKIGSDYNFEN